MIYTIQHPDYAPWGVLCLSILVTKTIHAHLQSHKLLQDVFHVAINDHSLSTNSSAHFYNHVGQLGASGR